MSRHDLPQPSQWRELTALATKREVFSTDLYFRECWADLCDVLGDSTVDTLAPLGLISMKCDGLVGRRAKAVIDFLHDNGFAIVGVHTFRLNRHAMRELWRYNWDVYTTDRLALMTLMHQALETLLLLVRDRRYDGDLPGAIRLASLKGSANPHERQPQHLRSVLSPPNPIINFVHVADEPADVVRELGIFLDRPQRRALAAAVADNWQQDRIEQALAVANRLQEAAPANAFELSASLARLTQDASLTSSQAARLRAAVNGEKMSWEELVAMVDPADPAIEFWDFVMVATEVLVAERPGQRDVFPPTTPAQWAAYRDANATP